MNPFGDHWSIDIPLAEVGYFKAKAYLLDPRGWQHWPAGPDAGISVHPNQYRTGNTIYCAFPRLFTKRPAPPPEKWPKFDVKSWDDAGYTIIPPSGKLHEVSTQLPHICQTLNCRILHLLPVHPTPTTMARLGRFGSPYAALDLTAIDPALVDFDKRTTGIDQFRELTYQTHRLGARVFLDIVINHTGWGSVLQENHPEWFLRNPDGTFASPGAWGITWEDLVELKHQNVALWDELSEIFLTWCRRGVDGFRCDAGYKVPVPAWQYIVARVQQEFPETIFLLEGLGGAWEATEALLTEGGMQWAYSELFQNYSPLQVSGYLDHSLKQSERVGVLVHYSETHDNERLAAKGRAWSLLRNRLCALTSTSGGFGFSCGVEWLAKERIDVHASSDLAWGNSDNLLPELGKLNSLIANHPCFFDGAKLTRLSTPDSPVYALHRLSEEGADAVLVLVNIDAASPATLELEARCLHTPAPESKNVKFENWVDLLGQSGPKTQKSGGDKIRFSLPAGSAFCLAPTAKPHGLQGDAYRHARARAAWAMRALNHILPAERLDPLDWRLLADRVDRSPSEFLSALSDSAGARTEANFTFGSSHSKSGTAEFFPSVVVWSSVDTRRITLVPPAHWLLVQDTVPFRATLRSNGSPAENVESVPAQGAHVACFPPRHTSADATLQLERYSEKDQRLEAAVRFLPPLPEEPLPGFQIPRPDDLVLLTNGRGGMARLCVDLGRIRSKYDCVLGASLHPTLPVDRHVFAKRLRVWVNADGFLSPLDLCNLTSFEPGPPAIWNFTAQAGDGRTVEIRLVADMLNGRNTTVFHFSRPSQSQATGKQLPPDADVRLTVRLDIEDRNFHWETKRNSGAEHHFSSHTRILPAPKVGFAFTPAQDRQLRVYSTAGLYHPQPEWSENIPHPVEQSRGQPGSGDAFSPGWFEIALPHGSSLEVVVTADPSDPEESEFSIVRTPAAHTAPMPANGDAFGSQLLRAVSAFVVRRDTGKTVIAGYPWFLDWGRDTFISARGLLAAGMAEEVKQLVLVFARFEKDGTLPNTIFGEDASNRDTSDAPLWFALVCEELAALPGSAPDFHDTPLASGRSLRQVLQGIASGYSKGTPNGIHMDPDSALIWSPSHFTWMDTNYPACSPREGYPVEIQALWVRLLRQLAHLDSAGRKHWDCLAAKALDSLNKYFWLKDLGYFSDVLLAKPGQSAAQATVDDALRGNCVFPIGLGLVEGARARSCVQAVARHLVVPGALRTLAPLPVRVPLRNCSAQGALLNNPSEPYWGHYEGDEDTRRKPAYHNGTAWTWTFPVFCEALARAWNFEPRSVAAAKAYLGSMSRLLDEGCLGQLPEIIDGDAPHTQRGCDAQAWGATEALRVWKLLNVK